MFRMSWIFGKKETIELMDDRIRKIVAKINIDLKGLIELYFNNSQIMV